MLYFSQRPVAHACPVREKWGGERVRSSGVLRAPSPILSLASPPYDEVEGAKIAVAVGCQSGEVHQLCAPLPSAYTSGLFEVLTLGDKE